MIDGIVSRKLNEKEMQKMLHIAKNTEYSRNFSIIMNIEFKYCA